MIRVGPRMMQAVRYVQRHPGCSKHEVARAVGPHGSNAFGDRTVKRAMGAGLIEDRGSPTRYALYVTPAGVALVAPDRITP